MKNFIFTQTLLVVLSSLFVFSLIGIQLSDFFIMHYHSIVTDQLDAYSIEIQACNDFKSVCKMYALYYGLLLLTFFSYSIFNYYFSKNKKLQFE